MLAIKKKLENSERKVLQRFEIATSNLQKGAWKPVQPELRYGRPKLRPNYGSSSHLSSNVARRAEGTIYLDQLEAWRAPCWQVKRKH
jgi:hypothetical protein